MNISFIDLFVAEVADKLIGIPTLNSVYKLECSMPQLIKDVRKQATARILMKEILTFVPISAQNMHIRMIDILRPIASHIRYKDTGILSLCFRSSDQYSEFWFRYLFLIGHVEFYDRLKEFFEQHPMFRENDIDYNPGDEVALLYPIFESTKYSEAHEYYVLLVDGQGSYKVIKTDNILLNFYQSYYSICACSGYLNGEIHTYIVIGEQEFYDFMNQYSHHTHSKITYSDNNFGINVEYIKNMNIFSIGILKAGQYFNLNKPFIYMNLKNIVDEPVELQVYSNSGRVIFSQKNYYIWKCIPLEVVYIGCQYDKHILIAQSANNVLSINIVNPYQYMFKLYSPKHQFNFMHTIFVDRDPTDLRFDIDGVGKCIDYVHKHKQLGNITNDPKNKFRVDVLSNANSTIVYTWDRSHDEEYKRIYVNNSRRYSRFSLVNITQPIYDTFVYILNRIFTPATMLLDIMRDSTSLSLFDHMNAMLVNKHNNDITVENYAQLDRVLAHKRSALSHDSEDMYSRRIYDDYLHNYLPCVKSQGKLYDVDIGSVLSASINYRNNIIHFSWNKVNARYCQIVVDRSKHKDGFTTDYSVFNNNLYSDSHTVSVGISGPFYTFHTSVTYMMNILKSGVHIRSNRQYFNFYKHHFSFGITYIHSSQHMNYMSLYFRVVRRVHKGILKFKLFAVPHMHNTTNSIIAFTDDTNRLNNRSLFSVNDLSKNYYTMLHKVKSNTYKGSSIMNIFKRFFFGCGLVYNMYTSHKKYDIQHKYGIIVDEQLNVSPIIDLKITRKAIKVPTANNNIISMSLNGTLNITVSLQLNIFGNISNMSNSNYNISLSVST